MVELTELNLRLNSLGERVDALHVKVSNYPQWSRAWDMAVKALVPITLAVVGWGIGHEIRVSNLELTSMSKVDGHALEQTLRVTPVWLKETLTEMKELLRDNDKRLRAIETKVK